MEARRGGERPAGGVEMARSPSALGKRDSFKSLHSSRRNSFGGNQEDNMKRFIARPNSLYHRASRKDLVRSQSSLKNATTARTRLWQKGDTQLQKWGLLLGRWYRRFIRPWELLQALLGWVSFGTSVLVTYSENNEPPKGTWLVVLSFFVHSMFIVDYALKVLMAPAKLRHVLSLASLVDILVLVLPWAFRPDSSERYMFLAVRVIKTNRILTAFEHTTVANTTGTQIAFMQIQWRVFRLVFLVGMIVGIIGVWMPLLEKDQFVDFHDGLYFAVVTLSTVGYGEFSPDTTRGRMFIAFMIFMSMVFVPSQVSSLNEAYSLMKSRRLGSEPPSSQHFVLVLGAFTTETIRKMVAEFYAEENLSITLKRGQNADGFKLVFLSPNEPNDEMIHYLNDPIVADRVQYLVGDPTNKLDLVAAKVHKATAVLILPDNIFDAPWENSDARAIMYALCVKSVAPSSKVIAAVFSPENKLIVDFLGVAYCFSFSEFRGQLVGRSLHSPGFSTLVLNLIDSGAQVQRLKNCAPWQDLFAKGMDMEIYSIRVPPKYVGQSFTECARDIYKSTGCILFALRRLRDDPKWTGKAGLRAPRGSHHAVRYLVSPGSDTPIMKGDTGFVIALETPKQLEIGALDLDGGQSKEQFGLAMDLGERQDTCKTNIENKPRAFSEFSIKRPSFSGHANRGGAEPDNGRNPIEENDNDNDNDNEADGNEVGDGGAGDDGGVPSGANNNTGASGLVHELEADGGRGLSRRSSTKFLEALESQAYMPRDAEGTPEEVAMVRAMKLESAEHLQDHVVVVGNMGFVEHLLSAIRSHSTEPYTGAVVFLVFRLESTPYLAWVARNFNPVYLIQAKFGTKEDLVATGVETARAVYVRRQQSHSNIGHWKRVVDPVATQLVLEMVMEDVHPAPFTVVDVYKGHSARLVNLSHSPNRNYERSPFHLSPSYAGGNVINHEYWEHTLMTQVVFKPFLRRLLTLMIHGQTLGSDPDKPLRCCCLQLSPLPSGWDGLVFGELVVGMLELGMVVVGLLRDKDMERAPVDWVLTNPDSGLKLSKHDRMFVFKSWDWDGKLGA